MSANQLNKYGILHVEGHLLGFSIPQMDIGPSEAFI